MSGWMNYFTGRRDPKVTAREAIVTLRTQLQMLEKKEENLQRKIDEELKKAKANAVSNKTVATAALRRKKAYESELDRLAGTRLTLETQVNTIESANLNAETMAAMKKGADALKVIHGTLTIDKVDTTMEAINAQRELANEISEAISNPINSGQDIDEDELKQELADLETEELDKLLEGADRVPVHNPGPKVAEDAQRRQEQDEEAELKELQAALAM
ncbi:late endosome to vacuole transport-related protein [Auriculariales sp. MPI-PUGE-AT-0066]|nr:late endosome to vacuole transport-related protein [Auriculariales sp. MPI-PUGE-AT-0066]